MADVSKLKRRLPSPPPSDEGAAGIERPPDPPVLVAAPPVLDGRSLRATGRDHQLNVRVTAETKSAILRLAKERQQVIAEVIEDAVAALVEQGR
ncbi:hypothetical protein ACVFYP_27455 [Roseomonas sp. F4]